MHGNIPSSHSIEVSSSVRLLTTWTLTSYHSASSLALDVISHHVWGPRRKSWGIEMTILTSLMRDVSRHSALADVVSAIYTVYNFGDDNVP